MGTVLECNSVVGEFELLSRNYVHFLTNTFRKRMNYVLNSITTVFFFYNDGFGIREPTRVGMPVFCVVPCQDWLWEKQLSDSVTSLSLSSHWVPLSYGLEPHLSKKLSKFPSLSLSLCICFSLAPFLSQSLFLPFSLSLSLLLSLYIYLYIYIYIYNWVSRSNWDINNTTQ